MDAICSGICFCAAIPFREFRQRGFVAMVRERPVIVSRDVGAAEIVQKAGAGLVFDGTNQDLAKALSIICENPALRQKMGAAGKREAQANYLWPKIAGQMESHYREILSERGLPDRTSALVTKKPS